MKIDDTKEEIEQLRDKELVITSLEKKESRKKLQQEIENAMEKRGTIVRRNFDSEMIRKILTAKRKEILNHVATEEPESITEIAEKLGRHPNEVSKDLEFLNKAGIIYFTKNKNKKQPLIPFKNIKIDFQLIKKEKTGLEA